MLIEMLCDKFISNGNPRGTITFKKGLNIVKGHNTGTNSIGKSSFLLAVDFTFGGDDYASSESKIIEHIGHHIVKFCFAFDKPYFFSRSTENKKSVNICDKDYIVQKAITIAEYCAMLFGLYKIKLADISFRNIVGRYFRIYGRDNLNEKMPLSNFRAEAQEDSLTAFLKLYNSYAPVTPFFIEVEKLKKDKEAITKQKIVQEIKKKAYIENLAKLEALQIQLTNLINYGRDDLLTVAPDQAEKAAELKSRLDDLNRKKKRYWYQYHSIKNASEIRRPANAEEFSELTRFFPNSDIRQLAEIEHFHASLSTILGDEFKSAMSSILALINELSSEIEEVEAAVKEINLPQRVSESTLKSYASVSKQIDAIQAENDNYDNKKKLEEKIRVASQKYASAFMEQIMAIKGTINAKIAELNTCIYGLEIMPPELKVLKPNTYEFGTATGDGTGTNWKNLILLDLSTLALTQLPALAHDTILFKHIGQIPMGKIIELYAESERQIFIAIDETTKYSTEAQKIVSDRTIIELSENGNELYGFSWAKRTNSEV